MFTGLIETMGTVVQVRRSGLSISLGIKPGMDNFDVAVGGSVSIDGVCLTMERCEGGVLWFTAVQETLSRSTLAQISIGRQVNLERALSASGRFDGHMVLGHVDAVGEISSDTPAGVSLLRSISLPFELLPFAAEKGSIAIDGISLTIASITGTQATISLIPHTIGRTTMAVKKPGDRVNIECDVVARYLYRFVKTGSASKEMGTASGESLVSRMERLGF